MLAQKNETIQKSILTLKELTADEKEKMQMEARERYRRDMASALDFGKEQGIEQSKQEIQSLKSTIKEQQNDFLQVQGKNMELQDKNTQLQAQTAKLQNENLQKDERIRFLEEQLAKENRK